MLARSSGRPIYPVAIATRHRIEVDTWDRCAINLPFGRGAVVAADPIRVAANAGDTELEDYRRLVETALDVATARAYAIADGKAAGAVGD